MGKQEERILSDLEFVTYLLIFLGFIMISSGTEQTEPGPPEYISIDCALQLPNTKKFLVVVFSDCAAYGILNVVAILPLVGV